MLSTAVYIAFALVSAALLMSFLRLLRGPGKPDRILALDRFMADTLRRKVPARELPIEVFPPWPMEGALETIHHDDNPFREEHGLSGKFVVMYSGNHSLVHPLGSLLPVPLSVR